MFKEAMMVLSGLFFLSCSTAQAVLHKHNMKIAEEQAIITMERESPFDEKQEPVLYADVPVSLILAEYHPHIHLIPFDRYSLLDAQKVSEKQERPVLNILGILMVILGGFCLALAVAISAFTAYICHYNKKGNEDHKE